MSYLVVVAHPDDEVLGAGGTIYNLAEKGERVSICILSGQVEVRTNRPRLEELNEDTNAALKLLGVEKAIIGTFPNIAFNTVNHVELVQFIENTIIDTKPNVVITHHPADLNNDHYHTSIACQAAVRLFQRRSDVAPVNELLFMEVPSSTDWSLNNTMKPFTPNFFMEIGKKAVDVKIQALAEYRGVMREYPHPRSAETITALATYRGSQAGFEYAEAFESVFRRSKK